MSETKWTPGPWKASGNGVHRGISCVAIAYDPDVVSGVTDVTQANARLIAAAPDLLAALEALFSNPHIYPGDLVYQVREREGLGWGGPAVTQWSDAVMAAKAAIEKAKGGE